MNRDARSATTAQLARTYRQSGAGDATQNSPLYQRITLALSESETALRAIQRVPARKRHPAVILAALHDLALSGQAPELAEAYASADPKTAAHTAIDTLLRRVDSVAELAQRRRPYTDETEARAVLYPAIAEAAHRVGADTVGLIDVDCAAGFDLTVDRVGITYSNGRFAGDPEAPTRITCSVRGPRPLPTHSIPEIIARIGIDRDPLDPTDPDDARWLRACLPPDRPERLARLAADIETTRAASPRLLRGDAVDMLPAAFARVPTDTLPVVTTAWALSRLSLEQRLRFLHRLEEAAAHRPVVWVSAEGVGVAPAIPTFGDRRASGHSIIGLAVFDHSTVHTEAVGRCWSRGRTVAWPASS